jgi:hypothetical protein
VREGDWKRAGAPRALLLASLLDNADKLCTHTHTHTHRDREWVRDAEVMMQGEGLELDRHAHCLRDVRQRWCVDDGVLRSLFQQGLCSLRVMSSVRAEWEQLSFAQAVKPWR